MQEGQNSSASAPGMAVAPSGNRRDDIQGLRALAVLTVVAFHAGLPMPGGFVGVDVFFVISGFVIARMLKREVETHGGIRFWEFYVRRFKRLTPALALVVAFTVLMSAVFQPYGADQNNTALTGLGALGFVANFVISLRSGGYFDAAAEANPLLHTWSLSVEEQFYFVFPLALSSGWLLARRGVSALNANLWLVLAISLVSFVLALWGSVQPDTAGFAIGGFYSPFARAWEFGAGAILALLWGFQLSEKAAAALGLVGVVLLAAGLWLINPATPFPGVWAILPVAGTACLIAAGTNPRNPFSRALSAGPMVRIGDWSYSIYLWHWPFVVFSVLIWREHPLVQTAAVAVAVIPAILSYHLVEQPLRNRPTPGRSSVAAMAAFVVVPVLLLSLGLAAGSRARWGIDWPGREAVRTDHVAFAGCLDKPFPAPGCEWSPGAPGGAVLLAGDSQAYAWADGVIEAVDGLGLSTVVTSRSGCPFVSGDTTGPKPADCVAWQDGVLAWALETRPRLVVIANRSGGYTRPDMGWRTMVDARGRPAGPDEAPALYEAALERTVARLSAAGIDVVLIQNAPEPPRLTSDRTLFRLIVPDDGAPRTFAPAPVLAWRQAAEDAERNVAARHAGVVLYDPVRSLCGQGDCPLQTPDGEPVFNDTLHLSRTGALSVAPDLGRTFQEVLAIDRDQPRPAG